MKKTHIDTVIIGGGIIGLSCAFEEKKRQKSVCIIDRKNIGKNNTSWASSGTIITRDVKKFFSQLRDMYIRSIKTIPEWLKTIASESGIDIPITKGGCYYLFDMSLENGEREHKILFSQINRELATDYVEIAHPPFLEKELFGDFKTVYFPNEHYLNNQILLQSLKKACLSLDVIMRENLICNIKEENDHVEIQLENELFYAKHLIIAAGAWSSEILEYFNLKLNIIPVKGQMVTIPKFYDSNAMVFFHRDVFMIPRNDILLVGSTQEKGVWNENFNNFGHDHIQENLEKYLPNVKFEIINQWAGVRSIVKDRYPLMGFINENKSVSLCTGHYKLGIAIAPLAARCMSQLISGIKTDFDITPFDPWRKKALGKLN